MIEINDQIIRHFKYITLDELKLYMALKRYMTEDLPIPINIIPDITSISPQGFPKALASLLERGIISMNPNILEESKDVRRSHISMLNKVIKNRVEILNSYGLSYINIVDEEQDSFYFIDIIIKDELSKTNNQGLLFFKQKVSDYEIDKKSLIREFKFFKTKKVKNNFILNYYLYSLLFSFFLKKSPLKKDGVNLKEKCSIISTSSASFEKKIKTSSKDSSLSRKVGKLESSFYESESQKIWIVLDMIEKKSAERQGDILVDYFADRLLDINSKETFSKKWRQGQVSAAKRIIREHRLLSLDDWKKAVDYFCKQTFWKDKLISLLQVERNLHQFTRQSNIKQTTQIDNKMKVIE